MMHFATLSSAMNVFTGDACRDMKRERGDSRVPRTEDIPRKRFGFISNPAHQIFGVGPVPWAAPFMRAR